jgi:hypothetical protein
VGVSSGEPTAVPAGSIVIVSTPPSSSGCLPGYRCGESAEPLRRSLIIMRHGACNQQEVTWLGDFLPPGRLRRLHCHLALLRS